MLRTKRLGPTQYIALGFMSVILIGSVLLALPIAHMPGTYVSYIDALFTSTSAVTVTGLISIETAEQFNAFGRLVIALLIQIGGLGVTSVGAIFILVMQRKFGVYHRLLLMEGLNFNSLSGVVRLVKSVLQLTLVIELVGMILSFFTFIQHYPFWEALGISAFHAIASFNNAGFDILGGGQNLIPYRHHYVLLLTTATLIGLGGIGFVTMLDIYHKRNFKKCSMNTKIVMVTTASLLIIGTILLKLSEGFSWFDAFFHSISARTAGFSTIPIDDFSQAGLLILMVLMFIGASPGSTGGGIKTTTLFTIIKTIKSFATNRPVTAFYRRIPAESIIKAFSVFLLAISVVFVGTFFILLIQPELSLQSILFEVIAATGTVGLSTGIIPSLNIANKLILCIIMFIGRLGPFSIACLWAYQTAAPRFNYPEEQITIG
ncbi:TrkH family potassium uptake protein [Turicibacter sanguinis]|uniref:TrkH family potassium uptake protein n=1 Tax=Turicibacter sanguinis TaxID=154288 RepID=UPI0021D48B3A|nr:potassium transporter TrkG [Turicibacter sanguinis]MCU7196886.1 H(+)-transporting ATPase [Turicibacter sanguinis]